jgi:hypothetical protein
VYSSSASVLDSVAWLVQWRQQLVLGAFSSLSVALAVAAAAWPSAVGILCRSRKKAARKSLAFANAPFLLLCAIIRKSWLALVVFT